MKKSKSLIITNIEKEDTGYVPTPNLSEFLKDYMKPYHMSAYTLAKLADVPVSRIQDILHDRRRITADTSVRLGKVFGLSDHFFLNLQSGIDARKAKEKLQKEEALDRVQTAVLKNA